uniref:Tyrosine specific protein phosphatases domain-containing protein n=1 Tax=Craspedostauros australis TaxID=1486917 RepID=A0A7R9ZLV5_9STRA|mmetsp:Transcript_21387/g.59448  ORF Transcript_21387/g.59448 Transcript_21387/m.59448 type:complete len:374 (+) Transcript_21387:134-1255(+)
MKILTFLLVSASSACGFSSPEASFRSHEHHSSHIVVLSSVLLSAKSDSNSDSDSAKTITTADTTMASTSDDCKILNFRAAAGLKDYNIFRCGATDNLASYVDPSASTSSSPPPMQSTDALVYNDAGLILDLRSDSERDNAKTRTWVQSSMNIVAVDAATTTIPDGQCDDRTILQIDVLSPQRFMAYVTQNWFPTTAQRLRLKWYKLMDGAALHAMRIEALNERGLRGLNEAILETGRSELNLALRWITVYLETRCAPVVIHCVKGKDRTGMLVMLLQTILEVPRDVIVEDYVASNAAFAKEAKPSAAIGMRKVGKLDKAKFAGTNAEAIRATFRHCEDKYGSVIGYLDAIGFDEGWRQRLRNVRRDEAPRSRL